MSILSRAFHRFATWFDKHNSVDELLADGHWMLDRLTGLADTKTAEAEQKTTDALTLARAGYHARIEAARALKVSANLKALYGVEDTPPTTGIAVTTNDGQGSE